MEVLQRDHRVAELEQELEFSGVDQVISVQCRRSDRENHFLIEQAQKSDQLVAGVVGWVPLDSPHIRVFLDQYIHEPLLKGIREIITGTPDEQFLDNPDFDHGMHELTRRDLAFDLFVSEEQLPAAIAFADRHPGQRMVINHCGCPHITAGAFRESWARDIRELARRPHVYCKVSGLTARARPRAHSKVRARFSTASSSGPISTYRVQGLRSHERLMYGSDWPLCNLTTSYPAWLTQPWTTSSLPLSEDEKNAIYRDTAVEFYQI